jgi:chemotaxis protein methyltransferase CheR
MDSYTITDHEFDLISRLVYDESGINLTENKKQLVIGRLGKRLRKLGLRTFKEYYSYLKENGGEKEVTTLLDCISTNKTDFFREPAQFDFLRRELIPEFLRSNNKKIRIWSAACSTGEEPYSIAISMHESIPETDSHDVKILASDISTKALDAAERGIYEAERLKPIPYDVIRRHFLMGTGNNVGTFKIKRHIRDMVVYRRINLMEASYPIRTVFDVIFFRNAMIYFDRPTQMEVVDKLSRYLKDGGYLFLGHSETLQGYESGLSYVRPNVYGKGLR